MKLLISAIFMSAFSLNAAAELVQLEDASLEAISAQSNGLTIDIDISDLAFTYSYKNKQNISENYWVMGTGAGAGSEYVRFDGNGDGLINDSDCNASDVGTGCRGSGAGLAQFNGMTLDIGSLPDNAAQSAIVIGLPTEIRLNRANTGDYYIAHDNSVDANAPPVAVDTTADRKLIGLQWNTPPPLNFANAGQTDAISASGTGVSDVIGKNFTNNPLRFEGQIYIFAN